jgi:TonB family protein
MKRVLLAMLACVLPCAMTSAQDGSEKRPAAAPQRQAAQRTEPSPPEVFEAQKLSAEVVNLYKAGKYEEATELAKRVLQILEKALAPGHPLIVEALSNVGELYRERRKYGEGADYYRRILAIYEQSPAPDPAAMAVVLDRLAYFSYMQYDFGKAEKLYERALSLREKAGGPNSPDSATSYFNLGEFYRLRGNYTKAEPLYHRAIEVRGSALGPDDEGVRLSLERFSCLYYATNQREKLKDIRKQFSFLREQDAARVDKGDVLNGKAISLPKPKYPQEAMSRGATGTVVIKVRIDERGRVIDAEDMCAADPSLAGVAVEAATQARFTPTLLSGKPVQVRGIITYRFLRR